MATLNTAFMIASNALEQDQSALTVISNNVANANTPGYTREIVDWEQNDPVTINGASYGMGANTTGPLSQRSLVLDGMLQQQTQVESGSSARLQALDQLQSIFNQGTDSDSSSNATSGIGQDISQFFTALSQLESSPADDSQRQQVLTAATTLAGDFNAAASQLSAQQSSLDEQSISVVGQVNALTQSIAQLNQQIQSSSPNSDAGTLEDQRQQDLLQLSQLVGIHQIQTENNGLTITTSSGAVLVSEGQSYSLTTGTVDGVTHIFDSQGTDVTSDLAAGGGQIGGILTVRDQDIPQAQNSLDTLAYDLGTAINQQNEAGADANGNAGVAIFNLSATSTGAAAAISVAITDPSQIAAAATGNGPSDDSNLIQMADLQNQAIIGGTTPTDYFSNFVTGIGSLVSEVSTQNGAQQVSLTQLQNQVNSFSSVDLNEEASSLETMEQSYEAASKIFTTLDLVMTAALNLGVETTYTG